MLTVLAALALLAAPPRFNRTLALFIRGERVGAVRLTFDGERFRYASTTAVRRGKTLTALSFRAETNAQGIGQTETGLRLGGPLPSTLALWLFAKGDANRCLQVEDERTGKPGQVCGTRSENHLEGTLLGEPFTAILDDDGGPISIDLPGQQTHFTAEDGPLPLPSPRDLFAQNLPAGVLNQLPNALAAEVTGYGEGCDISVTVGSAAPLRDSATLSNVHTPWTADARALEPKTQGRWASAVALTKFVSEGIRSVSASPADEDARGVWQARKGSCLGQARVFEALAGGLGIPARLVYGALVEDGTVAAHAWAEVEVGGRWFGVDPSRGLAPVGPDHLPFAREGDPDPLRAGRCLLALPQMHWTVKVPATAARVGRLRDSN